MVLMRPVREILSSGLAKYQHLPCTQDENRLLQHQAVPVEGELNAVIQIGKWLEDEESSISHEVQVTHEGSVDVRTATLYCALSLAGSVSKHRHHIIIHQRRPIPLAACWQQNLRCRKPAAAENPAQWRTHTLGERHLAQARRQRGKAL
nr:hypothetical protein CFP56_12013 [Quercus suber]